MKESTKKGNQTKVRDFLEEHGLTQIWLAKKLKMSSSLIRHHLDKVELEEELERRIRAIITENAKDVLTKLRGGTRKFI